MTAFKGIIALDIDGTITVSHHSLEDPVSEYLNSLVQQGWVLILVTGRTYSFSEPILSHLKEECFFAPQNGASLYKMPEGHCLLKRYILKSQLPRNGSVGMLIEAGKENGDRSYFIPADFSEADLAYLAFREKISKSPPWVRLDSFDDYPFDDFAAAKFFGSEEQVYALVKDLKQFNVTQITDPFREGYYLTIINSPHASKGEILDAFSALHPQGPVIVAGDDYNDLPMLQRGTLKIVMPDAPPALLALADIIAPPASKNGIIPALEQAIGLYKDGKTGQDLV